MHLRLVDTFLNHSYNHKFTLGMMDNGFLRDVLEGWMLGQENKSQKNTGTITLKRRLISKEELQRFEESS